MLQHNSHAAQGDYSKEEVACNDCMLLAAAPRYAEA
jgi:hypothetical protein